MRLIPHRSELGKGLKDEPTGLLFAIATLLSIALLLLMFSSARATRAEIAPINADEFAVTPVPRAAYASDASDGRIGASEQPISVARQHPWNRAESDGHPDAKNRGALRAAFLHVMASLGGSREH